MAAKAGATGKLTIMKGTADVAIKAMEREKNKKKAGAKTAAKIVAAAAGQGLVKKSK